MPNPSRIAQILKGGGIDPKLMASIQQSAMQPRVIHIELSPVTGEFKSGQSPMSYIELFGMVEFYKAQMMKKFVTSSGPMVTGDAAPQPTQPPEPAPAVDPVPAAPDAPGQGSSDPEAPKQPEPAPAPQPGGDVTPQAQPAEPAKDALA